MPKIFSQLYCRLAKFFEKRMEKRSKAWKEHDEKNKLLSFDPYDFDLGNDDGVFSRNPKNLHRFL